MAHADWYFKDWEQISRTLPNGRVKKEYVYRGDYFLLPSPAAAFKIKALAALLLHWGAVIWLNLMHMDAAVARHGRALGLLCLAPAIFWAMGGFNLLLAEKRMTYRRYHQSYRRLKVVCPISVFVTISALIATIYDAFTTPEQSIPMVFWCMLIVALIAAFCGWVQILRHPCCKEKAA